MNHYTEVRKAPEGMKLPPCVMQPCMNPTYIMFGLGPCFTPALCKDHATELTSMLATAIVESEPKKLELKKPTLHRV